MRGWRGSAIQALRARRQKSQICCACRDGISNATLRSRIIAVRLHNTIVRLVQMKRHMAKVVGVLVVAGALIAPLQAADDQTIIFAGAALKLGMPYQGAIDALGSSVGFQTTWSNRAGIALSVWSKAPPYRYFGQLVFRGGKLTSVGKSWTPDQLVTAEDAAKALIAAVRSAKPSNAPCTAVTQYTDQPVIQASSLEIRCGNRKISLSYIQNTDEGARAYRWTSGLTLSVKYYNYGASYAGSADDS